MDPDSTNLDQSPSAPRLRRITLKPPQPVAPPHQGMETRRSRRTASIASGSEYHASEKSADIEAIPDVEEKSPTPETKFTLSRAGRRVKATTIVESSDGEEEDVKPQNLFNQSNNRRVTRAATRTHSSPDEEDNLPRRTTRSNRSKTKDGFIVDEEEEEEEDGNGTYGARRRLRSSDHRPPPKAKSVPNGKSKRKAQPPRPGMTTRNSARTAVDDSFQPGDHTSSGGSLDGEGSNDEDAIGSSDLDIQVDIPLEPEPEPEEEDDGRPYAFRQRQKVNYAIPPPLEDLPPGKKANGKGPRGGPNGRGKGRLNWSANGAELGKLLGVRGDDSDSDAPTRTPRKPFGGLAPFGAGGIPAGGMMDLAAGGTPSNLGKIGDAALADADPLGVNQNVTFDEVGGLDDYIHQLKEMTLLPLLYPEVFQRFNVTPPRGVLFHGPPGTGKTLMARALAASCRSGGRQISFFMRKGADCLSKWVGEAERQLRLLFEEARNSQPSIIFFDEIDGLAPVRSSKQDQIHASIVSTLLALMDGMDGRGQVVVIGATNRPDAVDPALRRPGRFDREFYFGLPGLEAREKILSIMTKKWHGWGAGEEDEDEEKQAEIKERVNGLAKLTKGYGGADLRALCTEAALNAIQRRYPQVYKSNDRLLLKPETIGVGLRDFMISIKKLVPSSARSSSSAATPLPQQFVPLLNESLDKVKEVIQRVLPVEKKLSALEEAEFEDEGGEAGALEREMLSQAMQTLRVYRPRVVIHGPPGMGQGYLGAAALHHLEGYHVQSLELGSLMSDSTRTVEAAIVQLFIEAKRNQPSVIYIPSLVGWCAAVTETSRSTVRAMLDTLAPTDPILLLAVVDGSFIDLPRDVRAWFGPTKDNRVALHTPTPSEREAFFDGLLKDVQRPPNQFSDGMQRRKRILEELPIAPPLEPRKPTAAELAVQEENDAKLITILQYHLGNLLTDLKRKFKRFTKRATEEYNFDPQEASLGGLDTTSTTMVEVQQAPNGVIDLSGEPAAQVPDGQGAPPMNGVVLEQQQIMQQLPPLYDMDLERIQHYLFKSRYLTTQDFLEDLDKIVHNAEVRQHEDSDRLARAQAMMIHAKMTTDTYSDQLRLECERMAVRERQRREEARKEKEKLKGKETNGQVAPMGTRRSARHNGLQPEHPITDPVKLERRLKRQRGEDGSGGDSNGSEGEANGMVLDGERDHKRTRIVAEDEDDPLDTLNQPPGSESRVHVRFANIGPIEPMAPLFDPSQPPPFQSPNYQPLPSQSSFLQPQPEQMVVDSPSQYYGFNGPNSIATADDPFAGPAPWGPIPFNISQSAQQIPLPPVPQEPRHTGHLSFEEMLNSDTLTPPFLPPQLPLPGPQSRSRTRTPVPQVPLRQPSPLPIPSTSALPSTPSPAPPREPTPMAVERTPTPPLPDFNISETLVNQLRSLLKTETAGLTIEQLEQLRATSLGSVWRHRKEWERDELVQELIRDVKEFIQEVKEDEEAGKEEE